MSSIETFANNVKRLLAQRNIRIKDLAARIGLSESYLSLVLNGTRKNLNDEYKDRIASVLNVPLSLLYTEDVPVRDRDDRRAVFTDSHRHELKDVVELFLTKANLRHRRTPFYVVLGSLNDTDVHCVKYFLSELLKEFAVEDREGRESDLLDLSPDQARLHALYSLAGENARLEWIKAVSELAKEDFDRLAGDLKERQLVSLVEGTESTRVRLLVPYRSVTSLFSQNKIRDIYRSLARAMQLYPDEGAFFLNELGEVLVKANEDKEAAIYMEKAAKEFRREGLYEEAASSWHGCAVIHGILGHSENKGRCLCEAAKCAALGGNYLAARELADQASATFEAADLRALHENACNQLGAVFAPYDLDLAASWYKKGLDIASRDSSLYGPLLINLANIYLQRGKSGEAENALREARRWTEERSSPEVQHVLSHSALLMGLIELERRNWKSAREYFSSCIAEGQNTPQEYLASAWHNLGMIIYRADNMAEARKHLTAAQEIHKACGLMASWASGSIELAKVALREGNLKMARKHLDEALPHLDEQSLHEMGWLWLIDGSINRLSGSLSEAIDAGRKAVDYFQRDGTQRDLACAALWLAHVYRDMGHEQEEHLMEKRAFQIYDKNHWDVRELHRECSLLSPS
jgi:transcriptional regulator with XRE-family HTH domain/Tfp pilus assembly protein PilF